MCSFGVKAPTLGFNNEDLDHMVWIQSCQSFLLFMMLLNLSDVAGNLKDTSEVLASAVVEAALADGSVTDALIAAITSLLRDSSSARTDMMVLKPLRVLTDCLSFFFQAPLLMVVSPPCLPLLPPPPPPPTLPFSALRFLIAASLDLSRIFLPSCDFCHVTSSSF